MNRWLLVAALLALGLWLNTRHSEFPYYYHPDESKKVAQVITGSRNFNHPLLLLTTSEIVWKIAGRPADPQQVVQIGRWICAFFCTLGTIFFAMAAWSWRGPLAGTVSGILLTLNHQVFELAHYMKEDPALYLGVGLTAWSCVLYSKSSTSKNALVLGAAAGLAFAGKYLGLVLSVPALALIWCSAGQQKRGQMAWLVLGVAAMFAAWNFRLFGEISTFLQSFSKEMDWAVKGQKELTRSVPHSIYLNIFVSNTTPLIWLMLGAFSVELWKRRGPNLALTWCLVGTLLGWLVLLSFSPKTNDRYFLPLTGLVYLLAGAGAEFAWRSLQNRQLVMRGALLGIFLGAIFWEASRTVQFAKAFSQDDRAELAAWIVKQIPLGATIAYDARVNLPDEEVHHELLHPLPHRLLRETFVADISSPAELVKNRIDYVVISESTYGRFFLDSLRPKEGELAEYDRRADFYRELLKRPPLWKRERGNVLYLHPGLEVYEMAR